MGATTMTEVGNRDRARQRATSFQPDVETLPRERLAALQLERLARDGTQRVRPRAAASRAVRRNAASNAGGHPSLDDVRRLPFTLKIRSPRPLSVRDVRAAAAARSRGCTRRPAPPASRRSSATRRHDLDNVGRADGALDRVRRRAARRRRPQRLRLRPLHRRARRALRRRAARRGRGADVRRLDRAAGRADHGFRRARAVRDAVVRARHRRGRRAAGRRSAQERARSRPLRRRAVERRDAPRNRGAAGPQGHRHLRPVRDHGAGGRLRVRVPGRPARMGGSLPVRGDRSGVRQARCPKAQPGELVITTLTKEALPMLRYRTRDITRVT